jgi:hypothetical protein
MRMELCASIDGTQPIITKLPYLDAFPRVHHSVTESARAVA